MKPVLYYCYDAYCGWCYGFSKVIMKIEEEFRDRLDFEVLSGGMIPADEPRHISYIAKYIQTAHKRVEELSGVKFGNDFLWHVNHSEESDWYLQSEKSAVALCILKGYLPDKQIQLASELQYALNFEGRDLTDDEAYRHLLEKHSIEADGFYKKLHSNEYREKAHYEFALCRQLQVTGFPAVLVQAGDNKFYLAARGFTAYEDVAQRLNNIISEIDNG